MNLESHMHVWCVCVRARVNNHVPARLRKGETLFPVRGYRDAALGPRQDATCTHTLTCTYLCFEILQYRGQGKKTKILPPLHKYTHTRHLLAGFAAKIHVQQFSHCLPNPAFFSQNYCTDRHCGSTFPREEW